MGLARMSKSSRTRNQASIIPNNTLIQCNIEHCPFPLCGFDDATPARRDDGQRELEAKRQYDATEHRRPSGLHGEIELSAIASPIRQAWRSRYGPVCE